MGMFEITELLEVVIKQSTDTDKPLRFERPSAIQQRAILPVIKGKLNAQAVSRFMREN